MGPHHEKKIKRLIYPTLTFSALTTRLLGLRAILSFLKGIMEKRFKCFFFGFGFSK